MLWILKIDLMKKFKQRLLAVSEENWKKYLPHVSIDCVIFGFHNSELKILLGRFDGLKQWSLPGGYLKKNETLDECASRSLKDWTGAENIYLQQFRTFGDLNRSESFFADKDYPDDLWHRQRFISIGFYALVDFSRVDILKADFASECAWVNVYGNDKEMVIDHKEIYQSALRNLRRGLNYRPIGYNLLSETFTMPELQKLYETILDIKINRGTFYRKMIKYDILDNVGEKRTGQANKSPILYKFNIEKYNRALSDGFNEIW